MSENKAANQLLEYGEKFKVSTIAILDIYSCYIINLYFAFNRIRPKLLRLVSAPQLVINLTQ